MAELDMVPLAFAPSEAPPEPVRLIESLMQQQRRRGFAIDGVRYLYSFDKIEGHHRVYREGVERHWVTVPVDWVLRHGARFCALSAWSTLLGVVPELPR